jgi:hypothetical protein
MIALLASILTPLWLLGAIPIWRSFRRDAPAIGLWPRVGEVFVALAWPIAFVAVFALGVPIAISSIMVFVMSIMEPVGDE